VIGRQGRSGASVERGDERIAEAHALVLGALVPELAFDAEHAEVVTGDEIGVVAHLELDLADVARGEVGDTDRRRGEIDCAADVLLLRDHGAKVDADVAAIVPCGRWARYRRRRNCGEEIFAHGETPFPSCVPLRNIWGRAWFQACRKS